MPDAQGGFSALISPGSPSTPQFPDLVTKVRSHYPQSRPGIIWLSSCTTGGIEPRCVQLRQGPSLGPAPSESSKCWSPGPGFWASPLLGQALCNKPRSSWGNSRPGIHPCWAGPRAVDPVAMGECDRGADGLRGRVERAALTSCWRAEAGVGPRPDAGGRWKGEGLQAGRMGVGPGVSRV